MEAITKFMFGFVVNFFPTHSCPHLDEMLARWLVENFGAESYPGAKNAKYMIVRDRRKFRWSVAECVEKGYFPLGIGGGLTDDHSGPGGVRSESSCMKVYRMLFGDNDHCCAELKCLRRLVERVTAIDSGSSERATALHFETAIGVLWMGHEDGSSEYTEMVYQWFKRAMDALWEKGIPEMDRCLDVEVSRVAIESLSGKDEADAWWSFFQKAEESRKETLKQLAREIEVVAIIKVAKCPGVDHLIRIGGMETDNYNASRVMDRKFSCDIRVVRRSSGNVSILLNKDSGITTLAPLYEALVALGEGDRWSFQFGTQVLNGSRSDPEVEPTRLSLAEICQLLVESLGLYSITPAKQRRYYRKRPSSNGAVTAPAEAD